VEEEGGAPTPSSDRPGREAPGTVDRASISPATMARGGMKNLKEVTPFVVFIIYRVTGSNQLRKVAVLAHSSQLSFGINEYYIVSRYTVKHFSISSFIIYPSSFLSGSCGPVVLLILYFSLYTLYF
jgi:hypothetical protein